MSKELRIGIIASAIFAAIFLQDILMNINKPREKAGDLSPAYLVLDNNFKKLETLDFKNLFQIREFYPQKNTLAYGNSLLTESLVGLPVYILTKNTIISLNYSIIASLFLGFLFSYLLAIKLTKNIGASLIAALIFTYNPYVLSHLQIEQLAIEWIPLIYLICEEIISKGSSTKTSILLALSFMLVLASSFYYTFFITVSLPIYITLRIALTKKPARQLLHKSLFLSLAITAIFLIIFLKPFLEVRKTFTVKRSIQITSLLSAKPNDFLFTSSGNLLYGRFSKSSLRNGFSALHPTEHSLFPGIVPTFLVLLTIYLVFKKRFRQQDEVKIKALWGLLAVCIILSLGPYLEIGNIKFPFPYLLLYKFVPLADTLRAISRFMSVGFLAIGILSAFSWTQLAKINKQLAPFILFVILILISLEYYPQKLISPYIIPQNTIQFYNWLNMQKNINVIAELPFANDFTGTPYDHSFYDDGTYMIYAVYHNKYLLNGYLGFIPPQASVWGRFFAINFPTEQKIQKLKSIGVDTIIVHKDEYQSPKVYEVVLQRFKQLEEPVVHKIYDDGNISAYKIE